MRRFSIHASDDELLSPDWLPSGWSSQLRLRRADGRATILYDAFGNAENLKKDWGFSVLIEY